MGMFGEWKESKTELPPGACLSAAAKDKD